MKKKDENERHYFFLDLLGMPTVPEEFGGWNIEDLYSYIVDGFVSVHWSAKNNRPQLKGNYRYDRLDEGPSYTTLYVRDEVLQDVKTLIDQKRKERSEL